MSQNKYLEKFNNYKVANFKLDHQLMEKGKFYLLGRFKVTLNESTRFRFILRYPDKYAKQCVELYMNNNSYDKKKINFGETIYINNHDNDHFYVFIFKLDYFEYKAII